MSPVPTPSAPAVKRLVRLYYGFQFFFSLLLWIPIFYEYQKRVGLSDGQIFAIQGFYYLVFCLMEIPTGVLADLWGRRTCLKLGASVLVIANLVPIFAPSYFGFCTHFFLIALARSFISGASSAYLYQELLVRGVSSAEYKKVEGNARAYGLCGKVVLWPMIGMLMNWKLSLPYSLTAGAALISVIFAFRLPAETVPEGAPVGRRPALQFFAELAPALGGLRRSPLLILLMMQGVGIFVMSRVLQTNLFQPILNTKGFAVTSYGTVMAAMTVFEAMGSALPSVRSALRRVSDLNAVFALTGLIALSMAAIAFSGKVGVVGSLMVFSAAAGMAFPIQRQVMNDAISASPSAVRYRATFLSVESILDRAVCAFVVSWIGGYVASGRVGDFLQIAALACMIGMAVLYLGIRKLFDKPFRIIYPN